MVWTKYSVTVELGFSSFCLVYIYVFCDSVCDITEQL